MPQTREYVSLASHLGVPAIVVFLNKCDLVEEKKSLDDVEQEMRDLLAEYDFPGKTTPVIRGSALIATDDTTIQFYKYLNAPYVRSLGEKAIQNLLEAVDNTIPQPTRNLSAPFFMPIHDVFSSPRRGAVATGRIESGTIRIGDKIEIVGLRLTRKAVCGGMEMFRKRLDEGRAGDNVGILLRGVKHQEIERGQVLAAPGSTSPHAKFKAKVRLLCKEEGGRYTPVRTNYRAQFFFHTADITGTITLPKRIKRANPGTNLIAEAAIMRPVSMKPGLPFVIREGGRTVGTGVIRDLLDP